MMTLISRQQNREWKLSNYSASAAAAAAAAVVVERIRRRFEQNVVVVRRCRCEPVRQSVLPQTVARFPSSFLLPQATYKKPPTASPITPAAPASWSVVVVTPPLPPSASSTRCRWTRSNANRSCGSCRQQPSITWYTSSGHPVGFCSRMPSSRNWITCHRITHRLHVAFVL